MSEPETLIIGVQAITPDGVRHARMHYLTVDALENDIMGAVKDLIERFPGEVKDYYDDQATASN